MRDRLDFIFLSAAYAVVAIAFLAISLADNRVELAGTCAACFAFSTFCEWRRWAPIGRHSNVTALLLTLLTIVYGFVMGDYLPPLPFFVVGLLTLKLLSHKTARDWKQIFALGLMHLALAAVLTVDLSFALCYFLFAVAATWAVCLLNIWHERARLREAQPGGDTEQGIGLSFLAITGLLSLVSMVCAAAIFMVLPRVGLGNFGISRNSTRLTGFSESVQLDDLGPLLQNDTPVMRVVLSGPSAHRYEARYMRGAAFDRWDGARWTKSSHRALSIAGRNRDFRDLTRPTEIVPDSLRLIQEITLSPTGTAALFACPEPIIVREASFYADTVKVDLFNCLKLLVTPSIDIQYTAISALPDLQHRAAARVFPAQRPGGRDYTQLPDDLDPRLSALAQQWWQEIDAPYDLRRVELFAQRLLEHCEYTLDVPATPNGENPLAFFLFTSKRGHCELFATALAVLLRTLGVAARVANGFILQEYIPFEEYYLVRQSHAHAWTEVYVAPQGWLVVDATPSGSQATPLQVNDSFSALLDSVGFLWMRWVISYNAEDQRQLALDAKSMFSELKASSLQWLRETRDQLGIESMSSWGSSAGRWTLIVVLMALLAVVLLRRRWARLLGRSALLARNPSHLAAAAGLLHELEEALAGCGSPRRPPETAAEWLARLSLPELVWPQADQVLHGFHRLRYGNLPLDADERAGLMERIRALKDALRNASQTGAATSSRISATTSRQRL